MEGLKKAFKRLDGAKDVRFRGELTAFTLETMSAKPDYERIFTGIIEEWEHYNYKVKEIEISYE